MDADRCSIAEQCDTPPPLESGDRLTRAEFERRYEAMPDVKRAELINGVVYMGSPVRFRAHGRPHVVLLTWLGMYSALTIYTIKWRSIAAAECRNISSGACMKINSTGLRFTTVSTSVWCLMSPA